MRVADKMNERYMTLRGLPDPSDVLSFHEAGRRGCGCGLHVTPQDNGEPIRVRTFMDAWGEALVEDEYAATFAPDPDEDAEVM